MAWSYPGDTLLGQGLAAHFMTLLAVVLGYALLKIGSVLLFFYLHALNDQMTAFLVASGLTPYNPVLSSLPLRLWPLSPCLFCVTLSGETPQIDSTSLHCGNLNIIDLTAKRFYFIIYRSIKNIKTF